MESCVTMRSDCVEHLGGHEMTFYTVRTIIMPIMLEELCPWCGHVHCKSLQPFFIAHTLLRSHLNCFVVSLLISNRVHLFLCVTWLKPSDEVSQTGLIVKGLVCTMGRIGDSLPALTDVCSDTLINQSRFEAFGFANPVGTWPCGSPGATASSAVTQAIRSPCFFFLICVWMQI